MRLNIAIRMLQNVGVLLLPFLLIGLNYPIELLFSNKMEKKILREK